MFIKTKIKIKRLELKTKETAQKLHKQAQKLALAVVITEFLIAGGYYELVKYDILPLKSETITVINEVKAKETDPIEVEKPEIDTNKPNIDEISQYIYLHESTNGKNNYSKCESQGLINGIGYGIPGNGDYICFESHTEEMETLNKWVTKHINEGMDSTKILCHYSGNNYNICK